MQPGRLVAGLAVGSALLATVACGSTTPPSSTASPSKVTSPVTLEETGSTLLYPLWNIWGPAYTKVNPKVKLTTDSTGSGTGIAQGSTGQVEIGASDAYMSQGEMAQNPGTLNIPLVISAQVVAYHVPGVSKQLVLSGPVLAGMYSGQIKNWNDPRIAALNPGVTFPNLSIVPIHRSDSSGDSFIFTQFLSKSTPSWANTVSFSTSPSWPSVPTAIGATGNAGMVTTLAQTSGGVAYVGISYLSSLAQDNLPYAQLVNRSGRAVEPTTGNIAASAAALTPTTPKDEMVSLIFAPGASSYPIINYEYAIVASQQANANTAAAVRGILDWAVTKGQAPTYLDQVHFIPLPSGIAKLSQDQIASIR